MDWHSWQIIFARLACVCRYFAYYATCEMCYYLPFDGTERLPKTVRPPTPTGRWCTGIIDRLQPMETLRVKVKECRIQNWGAWAFPEQLPLVLSRLDNLRILTLSYTPASYSLLQAAGRLQSLEQLYLQHVCNLDDHPKEAIFGTHETPFPALHQLTISHLPGGMEVYKGAFRVLASAATLRSLVISDSHWLHSLLPHIPPDLVSLEGNFSGTPLDTFLEFINTHAALEDLGIHIYPLAKPLTHLYPTLDLDQDVLPNLRSFFGPFSLAPKFIRSRPVTRLAFGPPRPLTRTLSMLDPRVPLAFSQGFHGLRSSPMGLYPWGYNFTEDGDDIWDDLKTIGGGIQELFLQTCDANLPITTFSSCFPNLVHLQLELCWSERVSIYMQLCSFSLLKWVSKFDGDQQEELLLNLTEALKNFKCLKLLSLHSTYIIPWCFVSPGDQHSFVHRAFHEYCPTLSSVFFSPLMAWHLRAPSPRMAECHCELELLWPTYIRDELRGVWRFHYPKRVRDWKGKIADLFDEAPGLVSLELPQCV